MAGTTMAMVMLAAALAILAPAARGLDRAEFPPDFLFGVATSAYQEAYVGGDGVNHGETSTDAQNLGGEREHNDEDVEVVFVQENIDVEPNQTEPRVASAPSRSEQEKEPKRRRSAIGDVAAMMEKYMEMRAKQVEDEKGKAKAVDEFSIKKCINLLNTMYITSNEEIKAFRVFKIPENREIFLSANPEIALM